VRVNEEERALLEAASSRRGPVSATSSGARRSRPAEIDFLERRIVAIPGQDWEAFRGLGGTGRRGRSPRLKSSPAPIQMAEITRRDRLQKPTIAVDLIAAGSR